MEVSTAVLDTNLEATRMREPLVLASRESAEDNVLVTEAIRPDACSTNLFARSRLLPTTVSKYDIADDKTAQNWSTSPERAYLEISDSRASSASASMRTLLIAKGISLTRGTRVHVKKRL